MNFRLEIDPDIRIARTPPGRLYTDPELYAYTLERAFSPSWQLTGATAELSSPGSQRPFRLLSGSLDEPLVWVRDGPTTRCLSNVCSHRGLELVEAPCVEATQLRCRYHGRRFQLDGRLAAAPGFDGCANFPSERDHLAELDSGAFGPWLFCRLGRESSSALALDEWLAPLQERAGWLPFAALTHDPTRDREYVFDAHWALYADNYLEGFHIPYLHPGLTSGLSIQEYETQLFERGSLQVAVARAGEDAFDVPAGPDAGRRIAAYYYWLFPNLMLNLYPWGVSVNVVRPLGPQRTAVDFSSWVWDPSRLDRGAGGDLDTVELEDEAAVVSVQAGVRARLYRGGRYSPDHERGTHHFHRMLAALFE